MAICMTKYQLNSKILSRGKLGNGEHLSLEAYKYKENYIYLLIIMQHKDYMKFYQHIFIDLTSVDRNAFCNGV